MQDKEELDIVRRQQPRQSAKFQQQQLADSCPETLDTKKGRSVAARIGLQT